MVAERGHVSTLFEHAHAHYKSRDFHTSFALYSFLAELGFDVAQVNAAYMLEKGVLVFFLLT